MDRVRRIDLLRRNAGRRLSKRSGPAIALLKDPSLGTATLVILSCSCEFLAGEPMFFFDPLYFLFVLPPLLLGFYAQRKVKSSFEAMSQVPARMSGAQAARRMLDALLPSLETPHSTLNSESGTTRP